VGRLRESEEWTYVEREVDIRLVREGQHPAAAVVAAKALA